MSEEPSELHTVLTETNEEQQLQQPEAASLQQQPDTAAQQPDTAAQQPDTAAQQQQQPDTASLASKSSEVSKGRRARFKNNVAIMTEAEVLNLLCHECRRKLYFEHIDRTLHCLRCRGRPSRICSIIASGQDSSTEQPARKPSAVKSDLMLRKDATDNRKKKGTTNSTTTLPGKSPSAAQTKKASMFSAEDKSVNAREWVEGEKIRRSMVKKQDQGQGDKKSKVSIGAWGELKESQTQVKYGSIHCPYPVTRYLPSSHVVFLKHRIIRPCTAPVDRRRDSSTSQRSDHESVHSEGSRSTLGSRNSGRKSSTGTYLTTRAQYHYQNKDLDSYKRDTKVWHTGMMN